MFVWINNKAPIVDQEKKSCSRNQNYVLIGIYWNIYGKIPLTRKIVINYMLH